MTNYNPIRLQGLPTKTKMSDKTALKTGVVSFMSFELLDLKTIYTWVPLGNVRRWEWLKAPCVYRASCGGSPRHHTVHKVYIRGRQ